MLQGEKLALELSPPPRSMRDWQPKWVRTSTSTTAPQFYFIAYEPGIILGDDIYFLYEIPERASDYLTYLILADRERGERRFFTRRELGSLLRSHWRDFMGIWYPVLEDAGLMACGMKVTEAFQYGIDPRRKRDAAPAHAE